MNIANFNDRLHESDFWFHDGTKAVRQLSESVKTAPVFLFEDFENDKLISSENDDVIKMLITQENVLPFPRIRIHISANSEDAKDGTKGWNLWCEQFKGRAIVFAAGLGPWSSKQDEIIVINVRPDGKLGVGVRIGSKWMSNDYLKEGSPSGDLAQAIFTSFCWFVREVNSPANFIASVEPKKPGKSVEWKKARTHYVILHRSHPANDKLVAEGQGVVVGGGYLKRQAHTRRAHDRVLRSPKFKNKVGQTIRIRSTWVGPKEWEQSGSIYKLQNVRRG